MKRFVCAWIAVMLLTCASALAETVTLPPLLTQIEAEAFMGDTALDAVVTGDQLQEIGARAFAGSGLKSIILLESVTSIGEDAFAGCENLTIYCYENSFAHLYALFSGIHYELLNQPEEPQPEAFPIHIYNHRNSIPGVYETRYGTFDYWLEDRINETASTTYDPRLAYMLSSLAAAAYGDGHYISDAYETLGFENYQTIHHQSSLLNYQYSLITGTIGIKQNLVLVTLRGTGSDEEWISNFTMARMKNGWHLGFGTAAKAVFESLDQFLTQNGFEDGIRTPDLTFVVTGHSRGAAVANLLDVSLLDSGVPQENLYAYNFACPDTARLPLRTDWTTGYENIFNINNSADLIAFVPGLVLDGEAPSLLASLGTTAQNLFRSWGKFGRTYYYNQDWNDPDAYRPIRTLTAPNPYDSPHDYALYVEDMSKLPSTGDFKSRFEVMRLAMIKNLSFVQEWETIARQLFEGCRSH